MFDYLFSFQGRASRLSYVMFCFLWVLLTVAFVFAAVMFSFISPAFLPLGFIGLSVAAVLSSIAITVRRLHDLNLSGWIVAFNLALIALLYLFIIFGGVGVGSFVSDLNSALVLSPFVKSALIILNIHVNAFYAMLLVWPGTEEANRYG